MMLPGMNKLTLSAEALRGFIEDAINSSMQDGEDYVHVTEVRYSYVGNNFEVELTTDNPVRSSKAIPLVGEAA